MADRRQQIPEHLPLHLLKDQVLFPMVVLPLFVTEEEMAAIDAAVRDDHLLAVVACNVGPPIRFEEIPKIGTLCRVKQVFRFPEGGSKVVLEGLRRIRLLDCLRRRPFLQVRVTAVTEKGGGGLVAEALVRSVNALLKIALTYGRPLPGDVMQMIDQIEDPGRLADLVAVYLPLDLATQQRLLENFDPLERLKEVYLLLTAEVQKLQVRGEVQNEVAKRVGKTQKEYLLREQLKQIQDELGEDDPQRSETAGFRHRIARGGMPEAVKKVAEKELSRLERINPASPEYSVSRTYLDCLCSLPWNRKTEDLLDLCLAEQILDADHFDLREVKERILEHLAVRSLRRDSKGPILCFVGPPGVGKTSLGRSIARAMGRRFIRLSLGGMKDEAEIRGHRRTYIGALPGRIVQEISRCDANNPVFMLDEVDKIGQDFRGDPASALLEVLDPEQNHAFTDHYLDVPFDLSRVLFIATANTMEPIPPALRDRMEVLRLTGYSEEEKRQIASRYLVPKQVAENGLATQAVIFDDEALSKIIRDYTREAGVRNLERCISSVCRKIAREIAQHRPGRARISAEVVEEFLGAPLYFADARAEENRIGVATGLAWTETGGDIIFVEATRMSGSKELQLTGHLGEVMQESAKTALSFVRAHAGEFGIEDDFFDHCDLHIHVPSGAIAKDGPSAGITIAIALISLLTDRPARREVAMSGELTLSGRILPIGGVKEKLFAARRAGVTTVLLPAANRRNLVDLDQEYLADVKVVLVETLTDVIEETLLECENSSRPVRAQEILNPHAAPVPGCDPPSPADPSGSRISP